MAEKTNKQLTSDTITALRFPLIVGIVFIHYGVSQGIPFHGELYGANPPYWLVCFENLFRQVVSRIGVPLFFVMSGYLFFLSGLTKDLYRKKLKRRVRTLLVPYVLWNALFIAYMGLRNYMGLHSSSSTVQPANWSFLSILGSFWDKRLGVFADPNVPFKLISSMSSPQCTPMWYVRNLMLAVILSPLLYYLIKKAGWLVVAFFGVVWCFVFPKENYVLMTAFFFSWGACLAIKKIDLVLFMRRFRYALWLYPVFAIADMLTRGSLLNDYLHNIGIFVGIFAAVSLVSLLLEKEKLRVNKILADASFFVFALHTLTMGIPGKMIKTLLFIDSPVYMAALYILVPALNVLLCLALYWLLRRFAPRLCALLTGDR